ncbi:hypothetical protein [Fangia hongkongensis]|uniref:hypothetical protein n=1 Tax=Fangia hongkongensis TaxID=270495 RepID=UPI0003774F60|nr:hypothetical protein [Fangia hongkongensis]MBK2124846.1 hypothetical protein [Fangia hongkongensis]
MIFKEPRKKNGQICLGFELAYNPNNKAACRWFANNEPVSMEKVASVLEYDTVNQLRMAIRKHGHNRVFLIGHDKLRRKDGS